MLKQEDFQNRQFFRFSHDLLFDHIVNSPEFQGHDDLHKGMERLAEQRVPTQKLIDVPTYGNFLRELRRFQVPAVAMLIYWLFAGALTISSTMQGEHGELRIAAVPAVPKFTGIGPTPLAGPFVDLIGHDPGADPGAVIFDAIRASQESRRADLLIVDTAGRLQTKFNLMKELEKIKAVAGKQVHRAPHEVLLVLDGSTGQNAISQAKSFKESALHRLPRGIRC